MAKNKEKDDVFLEDEDILGEEFLDEETDEEEAEDLEEEAESDDDDEETDDDEDEDEDEDEDVKESFDFSDDVSALMEGESLPESFKDKAAIIFEAALTSKLAVLKEEMKQKAQAEVDRQVNEQTDATIELMVSTVDKYISHIAEEWLKENELAVEQGIKTEITENFMAGLKNLFVENYIDIPEEKVDVVESLVSEVSRLKKNLDEEIELNITLKESLNDKTKKEIVAEMAEDLSVLDQDKFLALTEDLELVSETSFRKKLNTIKESYFKKSASVGSSFRTSADEELEFLGSNIDESEDGPKTFSKMDFYAKALAPKIDPRFLGR